MKNFHWTCECSTTAVSICSDCPLGRLVFRSPQQQGGYRPSIPPQQPPRSGQWPNVQQVQQRSIAVSIAGVRITSSEIVRGPGNLIKGKVLIRITRIRARGRWCKSGKGELTSPPLQNFRMEPPSCQVYFLFITTQLLHYLIQEQLIGSLVTTVVHYLSASGPSLSLSSLQRLPTPSKRDPAVPVRNCPARCAAAPPLPVA
jgi:hypothetical protein